MNNGVLGFLSNIYNTFLRVDSVLSWFGGLTVTPWIGGGMITSLCYMFFFGLLKTAFSKLSAVSQAMSGFSDATSTVDVGLLSRVNYFIPVDVFATCVAIYLSVWVGVQVFRYLRMAFVLASHVAEKVPILQ